MHTKCEEWLEGLRYFLDPNTIEQMASIGLHVEKIDANKKYVYLRDQPKVPFIAKGAIQTGHGAILSCWQVATARGQIVAKDLCPGSCAGADKDAQRAVARHDVLGQQTPRVRPGPAGEVLGSGHRT